MAAATVSRRARSLPASADRQNRDEDFAVGPRRARSVASKHADVRFSRAIERRALWMAEDAARELPYLPLEDALQLVHL